jgi:acyl-CoA-binding protein
MADLDARFTFAVESVRTLPPTGPIQLSNDEKLAYYSWFKQVNFVSLFVFVVSGDNNKPKKNNQKKTKNKLTTMNPLSLFDAQATEGPCHVPQPGMFDIQGRYKWRSWRALGTMTRDEAKQCYIAKLVEDTRLLPESAETKSFVARLQGRPPGAAPTVESPSVLEVSAVQSLSGDTTPPPPPPPLPPTAAAAAAVVDDSFRFELGWLF